MPNKPEPTTEHDDQHSGSGSGSGSGSDSEPAWVTPPEFVRPISQTVDGFDLDPCTTHHDGGIAAETLPPTDGLEREWYGNVWCNPPYGQPAPWTGKAVEQSHNPHVNLICLLCKGDSSTDWWQTAITHTAAFCAINGRLQFGRKGVDAPFPSHLLVFGELPTELLDLLSTYGTVFQEPYQNTNQEYLDSYYG